MKTNIDNLRINATIEVNRLSETLSETIKILGEDDDLVEQIIADFNAVAQSVGVLNCVYDDNIECFSDLSESLMVEFLEVV